MTGTTKPPIAEMESMSPQAVGMSEISSSSRQKPGVEIQAENAIMAEAPITAAATVNPPIPR